MVLWYRLERQAQEERCEAATGYVGWEVEREEVRAFYGRSDVAAVEHSEVPVTFKNWLQQLASEATSRREVEGTFNE